MLDFLIIGKFLENKLLSKIWNTLKNSKFSKKKIRIYKFLKICITLEMVGFIENWKIEKNVENYI